MSKVDCILRCLFQIRGTVYFTYNGRKLRSVIHNVAGGMWPVVHIQKKVRTVVLIQNIIYWTYYYYRFIVRFPIGLDFLFITFRLHVFLSLTSSMSISSSDLHMFFSPSPHQFSSSQPTTSNDHDGLNSNINYQFSFSEHSCEG